MTEISDGQAVSDRQQRESRLTADLRALTDHTDRLERVFARQHRVSNNEMDALRHIIVSEHGGRPISSGELRLRLGVSSSAVTYLVDRMIEAGHIWRDTDPADRRRVMLRYSEHGKDVAQEFFRPLAVHTHAALAQLSDEDLDAAHRVLIALCHAVTAYHDSLSATES